MEDKKKKYRKIILIIVSIIVLSLIIYVLYSISKLDEARENFKSKEYTLIDLDYVINISNDEEVNKLKYYSEVGYDFGTYSIVKGEEFITFLFRQIQLCQDKLGTEKSQFKIDILNNLKSDSFEEIKKYCTLSEEEILNICNLEDNNEFLNKMEELKSEYKKNKLKIQSRSRYSKSFNKYLDEEGIELTAKEVQYNLKNNLDKQFILTGKASLDDYYNYGYGEFLEKDYFCISVEPVNSNYSDNWYIYCHRDSFEELYNKLLKGSINIDLVCKINKYRYKDGQGNMAAAEYISY